MWDLNSFRKFLLISFSVTLTTINFAQNFSVEDYQTFLNSHQNLTSEKLLQMYPANNFLENINGNSESALYHDSIDADYNLTDFEKSLLENAWFYG